MKLLFKTNLHACFPCIQSKYLKDNDRQSFKILTTVNKNYVFLLPEEEDTQASIIIVPTDFLSIKVVVAVLHPLGSSGIPSMPWRI